MKKFQIAVAATLAMGACVPTLSMAQTKHRTLKTVGAGVAGYELAKHSHNKFLKKHRLAAGVAAAVAAHHYMKKHH